MHLRAASSVCLMLLIIVDLCSSVPSVIDQTTKYASQSNSGSDKSEKTQHNDRSAAASNDTDHPNFLITNYLSDDEIERRIHFNGITAKETLVSKDG